MKLTFVSLLFFLLSCSNKGSLTQVTQEVKDILLIEMKRTSCFGKCPAYEVEVYNNGFISFKGKENVPYIGDTTFSLTPQDMQEMKNLIEEADLLELRDKYYQNNIFDLPTTYIKYFYSRGKKEIMDYYGAPESLKTFEKEFQNLIFSYLIE